MRTIFNDNAVIAATSLKSSGNMSLACLDPASALSNRQRFLSRIDIDHSALVCARQSHSSNIVPVDSRHKGRGAISIDNAISSCDAFVTDQKWLPLAIFTADCLSVFLYDPKACAVGIVHAGWRGTRENITAKTVSVMYERFASDPVNLLAGFGPSIGACCYEVGADLIQNFPGGIIKKDAKTYLDLVKVNKGQLLDRGVVSQNIKDDSDCTFCGGQFFSYRRHKDTTDRMMSVIMLR